MRQQSARPPHAHKKNKITEGTGVRVHPLVRTAPNQTLDGAHPCLLHAQGGRAPPCLPRRQRGSGQGGRPFKRNNTSHGGRSDKPDQEQCTVRTDSSHERQLWWDWKRLCVHCAWHPPGRSPIRHARERVSYKADGGCTPALHTLYRTTQRTRT